MQDRAAVECMEDGLVTALSVRSTNCGLRASWLGTLADLECPRSHYPMQNDELALQIGWRGGIAA